jgi:cytoskeletal protein RodZ
MTTVPLPTSDPGAPPPAAGGSKRIILILGIVAGVLLLTVVAIVFLLIGRGTAQPDAGDTPTPTATTTESPTPTPTPTEEEDEPSEAPVDNSTRFTNFSADLTVECDPTGEQDKPEITFSWTAANAVEAWYTPSDEDAKNDNYMQFPNANAGSNNDLTDEHLFPCNHDQYLDVTITLVGPGGEHVSHHVVYEDVNWQG